MELDQFLIAARTEIAGLVRSGGVKTCVFPVNGTRRWFRMEYPDVPEEERAERYLEAAFRRYRENFTLFFEHGIETLLCPVFGPDLLDRGPSYRRMALEGLARLASQEQFLAFYTEYGVRVRFYGDYARFLTRPEEKAVLDIFAETEAKTRAHERRRLYFGLFAHDAAEAVAAFGASYYAENGRSPSRDEIVRAYYGDDVDPVSIFIGFGPPAAFDMPLVATGHEDLYFMVAPSLYLDETILRHILYDHLFARRLDEDYTGMTAEMEQQSAAFYRLNRREVLGVGSRWGDGHFWVPKISITTPSGSP